MQRVTVLRILCGAMALAFVACENGGDGSGSSGSSFALTSCDTTDQCDAGFECAVFPCPADCAADANGRCDTDTCQAGAICLPRPPVECDPALCGPGDVCQRSCSGACDLAAGQCTDVACQVVCLPVGTPTEPPPDQACVTDFTDACLPPDYPVAARLDDVCAAQGMLLTNVSVAAECWPGAVQFSWTCCRGGGWPTTDDPDRPTPDDPGQPTCVRGSTDACLPPDAPVKERLALQCESQGLQLTDLIPLPCDNGFLRWEWTCCRAGAVEPPPGPSCDKACDESGVCFERCCDPATGQCWGNDPDQPPPPCGKVCDSSGQCWEQCCDAATGECAPTDPTQPPSDCQKTCDADGTCTETCCDANDQCWTTTYPGTPTPTDPNACVGQTTGGDGTCTDLETLLAFASWTCAASGATLTDYGPWGECDGGWLGLKFACCPAP